MELPLEYVVQRVDNHWVVVGPTGIFVVGRARGDVAASAEQTSALAHELRAALSERISWVPFVDAILVADGDHGGLACTVVPLDLLVVALTSGGVTIDVSGLAQVQHHLPATLGEIERAHRRPLDPA
jgi:hypothetical protein